MKDQTDIYWGDAQFEDCVARALIGLFENKIAKEAKRAPRSVRITDKDIIRLKCMGLFICSPGTVTGVRQYYGYSLPMQANWTHFYGHKRNTLDPSSYFNTYMDVFTARRIKRRDIPSDFVAPDGAAFEVVCLMYLNDKIEGIKWYATIDKTGRTYGASRYVDGKRVVNDGTEGVLSPEEHAAVSLSAVLNFDMQKYDNWLVTAREGRNKASFGVHEEQIKSLFYARSIPLTESGRRRPILHWVRQHTRRLERGVEIDVNRHLRGITEFVWQGTKFTIVSPQKAEKAA